MSIKERSPQRLILKSGGTTLALDLQAGTAVMQRKLFFWKLKPTEAPISEIVDINADTSVDRASGVEVCSTILVMRSGAGWAMPAWDKKDAEATGDAIRHFLGIAHRSTSQS
jgi:hypothetical protein